MSVVLPCGATDATFFVTRHPIKSISNSIIDFDLRNVEIVLPTELKKETHKVTERINSHYLKSRQLEARCFGEKHDDDFQQYNWGLSLTLEMGLFSDQAELLMVLYAKNVEGRMTEKEFHVIVLLHTTFRHLPKYKKKTTWKDLMASWKIKMKKSKLLPPTISKKAFIKILEVNFIDFDLNIDQISKDLLKLDSEGDYLQSLLLDDPILRGEIPKQRKKTSYLPSSPSKDQTEITSVNQFGFSFVDEKSSSTQDRQRMLRLQKSFSHYDEVDNNLVQESESARREAIDASNDELAMRVMEIKRERQIKRLQEIEKAQMEATAELFEATRSISAIERGVTSLHIPVSLPNTARKYGYTPRSAMNTSRPLIERSASYTPTSVPRKCIPKTLSLPLESTINADLYSTESILPICTEAAVPAPMNTDVPDLLPQFKFEQNITPSTMNADDGGLTSLLETEHNTTASTMNADDGGLTPQFKTEQNATPLTMNTDDGDLPQFKFEQNITPSTMNADDGGLTPQFKTEQSTTAREGPRSEFSLYARKETPRSPRKYETLPQNEAGSPNLLSPKLTQSSLHSGTSHQSNHPEISSPPPKSSLRSPKMTTNDRDLRVPAIIEEVSQPSNFPNLTDLFELPYVDMLFNVPKTGNALRVLIRHDDEGDASGLFVHGFIPYSRAEEQGFLKVSDEIISVNGVHVEGKGLDDIVLALQHHHDEFVPIVIRRRDPLIPPSPWRSPRLPLTFEGHSPRPFTTEDGSQPNDFPELSELFTLPSKNVLIEVPKTHGQLRVMIRHDDDGAYKGLFVHGFRPYSNAEAQGLLQVGDEILEVDGVNITGSQIEELIDLLKANRRDFVSLLVCRRDFFSGLASREPVHSSHSANSPRFLCETSDPHPPTPQALTDFVTGTQNCLVAVPRTDGLLRVVIKKTGNDFYVHGFKGKSRAESVLKPGDIIFAINGNPVLGLTLKEMAALISSCELDEVPMIIRRNFTSRSSL